MVGLGPISGQPISALPDSGAAPVALDDGADSFWSGRLAACVVAAAVAVTQPWQYEQHDVVPAGAAPVALDEGDFARVSPWASAPPPLQSWAYDDGSAAFPAAPTIVEDADDWRAPAPWQVFGPQHPALHQDDPAGSLYGIADELHRAPYSGPPWQAPTDAARASVETWRYDVQEPAGSLYGVPDVDPWRVVGPQVEARNVGRATADDDFVPAPVPPALEDGGWSQPAPWASSSPTHPRCDDDYAPALATDDEGRAPNLVQSAYPLPVALGDADQYSPALAVDEDGWSQPAQQVDARVVTTWVGDDELASTPLGVDEVYVAPGTLPPWQWQHIPPPLVVQSWRFEALDLRGRTHSDAPPWRTADAGTERRTAAVAAESRSASAGTERRTATVTSESRTADAGEEGNDA